MASVVRCYTLYLNDLTLRLNSSSYSTNSSTFENSLCKLLFKFNFDEEKNEMSVFLCRINDDGPNGFSAKFMICLKSLGGGIFHKFESTFTFLKGSKMRCFCKKVTKEDFLASVRNKYNKDTLIIECEVVDLKPSFTFLNEDIRVLSQNLMKLRNETQLANAYLHVECCDIPVHKEILSARSFIFERIFRSGVCVIPINFPMSVVQAMLDFLYSGDISRVDFSRVSPPELRECAQQYRIDELSQILSPRLTFATSLVHKKTELQTLRFPYFTKLYKTLLSVEHSRINMQFDENIEMMVKVILRSYDGCGNIIVETTLSNARSVIGVFIQLFILDDSDRRRVANEVFLEPDGRGEMKFRVAYESEALFSEENLILPKDVLSLQYEFKFRLPGEFHIADPDIQCRKNYDNGYSLSKCMESLLESQRFTSGLLVLPSNRRPNLKFNEVGVHKSILSARSPVFSALFRESSKIVVALPAFIVASLLYFVYTGVILFPQVTALHLLHEAASTFRIDALRHACERAANTVTLDSRNVYSIFLIAVRAENYSLQESCRAFVRRNEDIIFGSFQLENFKMNNSEEFERLTDVPAR